MTKNQLSNKPQITNDVSCKQQMKYFSYKIWIWWLYTCIHGWVFAITFAITLTDALPSSLIDSNMSLKWK